jgi:hypothetical protein
VARLVALLVARGVPPRPPVTAELPTFGRAIENSVLYFQMTHQNEAGAWLDVDGIVGPDTWWALGHATGDNQRSFLEVGIPKGIEGERRALLETAVKQHGVREDRGRANRGPEVDKFLPTSITSDPAREGQPWCCYFVSWVAREVYGRHIMGRPVASCYTAWQRAHENDRWIRNDSSNTPTPGDAFVILHQEPSRGWCTGHIGLVLQLGSDGRSINTVEGNCGNRVKIGTRSLGDPQLRGFINIVGDRPSFERGSLRGAKNLGASGTR